MKKIDEILYWQRQCGFTPYTWLCIIIGIEPNTDIIHIRREIVWEAAGFRIFIKNLENGLHTAMYRSILMICEKFMINITKNYFKNVYEWLFVFKNRKYQNCSPLKMRLKRNNW